MSKNWRAALVAGVLVGALPGSTPAQLQPPLMPQGQDRPAGDTWKEFQQKKFEAEQKAMQAEVAKSVQDTVDRMTADRHRFEAQEQRRQAMHHLVNGVFYVVVAVGLVIFALVKVLKRRTPRTP